MEKKVINTPKAPLSTSPVSQCNIVNNTIYDHNGKIDFISIEDGAKILIVFLK